MDGRRRQPKPRRRRTRRGTRPSRQLRRRPSPPRCTRADPVRGPRPLAITLPFALPATRALLRGSLNGLLNHTLASSRCAQAITAAPATVESASRRMRKTRGSARARWVTCARVGARPPAAAGRRQNTTARRRRRRRRTQRQPQRRTRARLRQARRRSTRRVAPRPAPPLRPPRLRPRRRRCAPRPCPAPSSFSSAAGALGPVANFARSAHCQSTDVRVLSRTSLGACAVQTGTAARFSGPASR